MCIRYVVFTKTNSVSHSKDIIGTWIIKRFKSMLFTRFFKTFYNIIQSGLEEDTAKDICSRLKFAKTYLKTDYKIHVSRADPCGDHCSVYALSNDEQEYHGHCDHEHNLV